MGNEKQRANLIPWQKGKSGNPSGRPKRRPITEAYIQRERIIASLRESEAYAGPDQEGALMCSIDCQIELMILDLLDAEG